MPFILQNRRLPMLAGDIAEPEPGDLCFKHYHAMVTRWRAEPRWTTAHNIYAEGAPFSTWDENIAWQLAWQVFFQLFVMPYERQKRQENGNV